MTDLEKLIAESIEARDAAERAKAEINAAAEVARKARIEQILKDHVRIAASAIPSPLIPFLKYAGDEPSREWLDQHGADWHPSRFKVKGAPGLDAISFEITYYHNGDGKTPARAEIARIWAGGDCFHDWTSAIAQAADKWRDQQAWEAECEAIKARRTANPEPKAPSLAERLESLIREIARDEVGRLEI